MAIIKVAATNPRFDTVISQRVASPTVTPNANLLDSAFAAKANLYGRVFTTANGTKMAYRHAGYLDKMDSFAAPSTDRQNRVAVDVSDSSYYTTFFSRYAQVADIVESIINSAYTASSVTSKIDYHNKIMLEILIPRADILSADGFTSARFTYGIDQKVDPTSSKVLATSFKIPDTSFTTQQDIDQLIEMIGTKINDDINGLVFEYLSTASATNPLFGVAPYANTDLLANFAGFTGQSKLVGAGGTSMTTPANFPIGTNKIIARIGFVNLFANNYNDGTYTYFDSILNITLLNSITLGSGYSGVTTPGDSTLLSSRFGRYGDADKELSVNTYLG